MKSEIKSLLIAWCLAICIVGATISVFDPTIPKRVILLGISASILYVIIYIIGLYIKHRNKQ